MVPFSNSTDACVWFTETASLDLYGPSLRSKLAVLVDNILPKSEEKYRARSALAVG